MKVTIYKITNIRNGKIYIGSTKEDANTRFNYHINGISNPDSIWSKGMKWYEEVRLNNDLNNLVLEVLDQSEVSDSKERNELETKWLKKYFNELGSNLMYNQTAYANCFSDPEVYKNFVAKRDYKSLCKKMVETKISKYGKGSSTTIESAKRAYQTALNANEGVHPLNSKEAIYKKRLALSDILEYNGKRFLGTRELLGFLNSTENIPIGYTTLRKIINGDRVKKYPELFGKIIKLKD